ncbi:MAG: hypothetical protein ABJH72_01790 [Reichenbachiella sp.]|uniref:hypothetical protein n=1 Tax=Reichenbachiella sp. TaxID=2184521 RepID=UPI003266D211
MNKFAFWDDWETPFRLTFKALSLLLIIFLGAFLIIEWGQLSPFYYWKITGYLEHIPFPVFSNHSEFIESTITTDMPLIFQKIFGGSNTLSVGYTYAYLIVLYVGLIGCLTLATYLENFWYFLSMGLWILLIMLSGIGKIGLFGFYDEIPIIIVALLFLPASYYFNTIDDSIGLGKRFLIFLALLLVTFGLIHFGSSYDQPLLFLTRFSYLPAAVVCLIFILIVGHEIVYAILSLTTPYSKSSSNNTTHFIVLSSVYLLNLVALYLHQIGYLDWNIYYLNEFAVIALSTILGIWGIKSREERYAGILPFYPYTALLYLWLAIISFATFSYQAWHANDPFLESMQNLILYSHIGFGSMFFLYIIGNFITQLRQNLPVHQFAYVEDNFPYISARIAGLIVVAALFFRAHYASFNLAVAGYYNGLADLNISLDKSETAYYYYKESTGQSMHNHHANFQLAQSEKKPSYRLTYLKNTLEKKPTPYAYASLGKEYENASQFFDALFTYQEGLEVFPKNWALQNNLALLYNKTNVVDSAVYYLKNNSPGSWKKSVVQSNLKAVLAMHGMRGDNESDEEPDRFDLQSNTIANKTIIQDTSRLKFITEPQTRALNLFTFSYLKNLGIYCYQNNQPEYLRIIDSYLDAPENISFRRDLILVKALNLYQAGRIASAIEIIYQLKEADEDESGQWNSLLGKWCLELNAPLQASKYFEKARESYYPNVSADLAQAYYRLGDQSLALFMLSKESDTNDTLNSNQTAWVQLFDAMQNHQVSWEIYSFEREKALLENAKKAESNKHILFEQLGLGNPYFQEGVIAAARYFQQEDKDEETAYRILHQAITINEFSDLLIKAYIDHCLNTGLIDFADDALARLADILSENEYTAYKVAFESKKESAQTDLDKNW